MGKRRPKNGYCISCGKALKRPPAFDESCTMRCAANAWYALQGAGGGLDNEHCNLCGEQVTDCLLKAVALGHEYCVEEE